GHEEPGLPGPPGPRRGVGRHRQGPHAGSPGSERCFRREISHSCRDGPERLPKSPRLRKSFRDRAWDESSTGRHFPRETAMTPKRVLITGMSGLIGGIMREVLASRYDLVALNRRPVPGVRCVQADIADLQAIRPAFADVDVVLHLAALA